MERSTTIRKVVLAAILGASSMTAMADSGALVGFSAGRSEAKMDEFGIKGHATAWEVFGGWEFNRYLAIEAGYIDGGKPKDGAEGVVLEQDISAFQASLTASLPLGEHFGVYGRAGVLHWKSDQELRVDGETIAQQDLDGDDPFYGVGLTGTVEGALIRLEYRMADIDDSDLSLLSLGIAWRF